MQITRFACVKSLPLFSKIMGEMANKHDTNYMGKHAHMVNIPFTHVKVVMVFLSLQNILHVLSVPTM